jgi:hypothetical protein
MPVLGHGCSLSHPSSSNFCLGVSTPVQDTALKLLIYARYCINYRYHVNEEMRCKLNEWGIKQKYSEKIWRNDLDDFRFNKKFFEELFVYFSLIRHSRHSDWLLAGWPRSRSSSPGGVKNFHLSKSSRLALRSTQPPVRWVPGALPQG